MVKNKTIHTLFLTICLCVYSIRERRIAIQVAFTDEVEYIVHEYIEEEWPQDGSLGYPLRYATPFTADLSKFDSLFSGGEVIFY